MRELHCFICERIFGYSNNEPDVAIFCSKECASIWNENK